MKYHKARYITAALIAAASVVLTPACIEAARRARGYAAYGGEYLLVPVGLLLALIVLEAAKLFDKPLVAENEKARVPANDE